MSSPSSPSLGPDRHAALAQYRRRAAVYDLELALFEPLRRSAVQRLGLHPGDTVLDVGCGTGLSLPLLRAAVGARGRVIGLEQSPEMLARAQARVDRAGWRNVRLQRCALEQAPRLPAADAALLHFTHDVLRHPEGLGRLAAALKPGARVVACGLKWAPRRRLPLNLFVLGAALRSVSTLQGLDAPWRLLAQRLGAPELDSALGGTVYFARWQVPAGTPLRRRQHRSSIR